MPIPRSLANAITSATSSGPRQRTTACGRGSPNPGQSRVLVCGGAGPRELAGYGPAQRTPPGSPASARLTRPRDAVSGRAPSGAPGHAC